MAYPEEPIHTGSTTTHRGQTGCAITGSGAVEPARGTVGQKQRKLSGQRWRNNEAGHMLNRRSLPLNHHRNKGIQPAKTTFANTACLNKISNATHG